MLRLTYVGHGTVLVDLDGARLLTDPALRTVVAHLRRSGPGDRDALRGVDAAPISHLVATYPLTRAPSSFGAGA